MASVQGPVPADIRKYQTKILGPLTLRQIVCIAIAGAIDLVFFQTIQPVLQIPLNSLVYVLMAINLPILAFTINLNGMTFERFLINVLYKYYVLPTKRKSKKVLYSVQREPVIRKGKEKKEYEQRLKKFLEEHPDCKAIK